MQYQSQKPLPFDFLNDSQSEIQTNFSLANTYFGKEHYPYDDPVEGGKHKYSIYPSQESRPVTTDTDMALFNEVVEGERTNLMTRYQDSGVVFPFMPYMAAYIQLDSNSENPISVLGTNVNLDVNRSGWTRRVVTLYFQKKTQNILYFAEVYRASLPNISPIRIQIQNKDEMHFEFTNGAHVAGDRFYVRVY